MAAPSISARWSATDAAAHDRRAGAGMCGVRHAGRGPALSHGAGRRACRRAAARARHRLGGGCGGPGRLVVNGDVFRRQWMWTRIAEWFGLEATRFDGTPQPIGPQMANDAERWRRIAEREGLAGPDLARLASPGHTDAGLGRPIEVVTDMSNSRRLEFTGYQPADDAFLALFDRLRADRPIP